jgi:NAD(P)-dependent dehydrogenase (short-subunit alcohol dehydrogenase family)
VLGSVAFPGHAAYTASKHGVIGLTKAAALDHAADGIRVNAVAPAFIDVPAKQRSHTNDEVAGLHPLGRLGTVDEVAELVVWLASDAASFATGSVFPLDGGFLAR